MRTSILFMLVIQGAVAIITGILYHKVLTLGKKKEAEKKDRGEKD